jgi:hypothetical protein
MTDQDIERIRIAIPHAAGGARWLFLAREDERRWHPWWGELFRSLLALRPRVPAGINKDGTEMEISLLGGEARERFLSFVRTAPDTEMAEHRTLRSVTRVAAETDQDIEVRFFGAAPSGVPSEQ